MSLAGDKPGAQMQNFLNSRKAQGTATAAGLPGRSSQHNPVRREPNLKLRTLKLSCCLGIALCGAWVWRNAGHNYSVSAQTQPNGPTSSAPIAVTPDDKLVWVANPDSNSVSIIN